MKTDRNLIKQAKGLKQRHTFIDGERLEKMIYDYESACILSRGPIEERAIVWEQKAFDRSLELLRVVKNGKFKTSGKKLSASRE